MALDANTVLDAVLTGAPLESSEFSQAQLEQARTLAAASPPDTALAVSLPEPLALALLAHASRARKVDLAAAFSASTNKAVSKAAKKALYQLRSLGVDVPATPSPARVAEGDPSGNATSPGVDDELPAFLTPFNGVGERALLLPRGVQGGGLEVFHFLISDELGVVHLETHASSRSTYRKTSREMTQQKPLAALRIELGEAHRILGHAAHLNRAGEHGIPEGLDRVLRKLAIEPKESPVNVPEPGADDAATSRAAGALHEEPELRGWLPPMEHLRTLALKMDEILASPLYIDERQRAAALASLVDTMAEGFLDAHVRPLYGRRLWEVGRFFDADGRSDAAAKARAEARRLFHLPVGTPSVFIREMFEKVLALTARARTAHGAPGLADPHRHPAAQTEGALPAAPSERRSPGGLILP